MSEDDSDEPLSAEETQPTASHEQILEAVADPVCTVTADGHLGYVNEAFERQTGYEADAVHGESLTFVIDSDDRQEILAAIEEGQASEKATSQTLEATLHPRKGGEVPVECTLRVLERESGTHVGVLSLRNITARKAREKRLSKFAGVVSHDLRNPLDVALGRAEVLPEIADVDEENERHLEEIHNSLKRMDQLIQDALTLSRQRQRNVETELVDLESVARDAWGTVATDEATLTVQNTMEVYAHRSRLRRLFENLFRNAVEHGSTNPASQTQQDAVEHGDDGLTVEVGTLDAEEGQRGFYVADDGPGIDEIDRERLFEGGYSTSKEGTGLGLTIVREIADAHGWTVSVRPREENVDRSGARFEITGVEGTN